MGPENMAGTISLGVEEERLGLWGEQMQTSVYRMRENNGVMLYEHPFSRFSQSDF